MMTAEDFRRMMAAANTEGDKGKRKVRHDEDDYQVAIVKHWDAYARAKFGTWAVKLLHHSPNGGFRTEATGARFKKMGTRRGFPDLFLMIPTSKKHGLFIELKTEDGRQSGSQKEYEKLLKEQGYEYVLLKAKDAYDAVTQFEGIVERYLNENE